MTETTTSRTTRKICIQTQRGELDLSVGPEGVGLRVMQENATGVPALIEVHNAPIHLAAQLRDFLVFALKDYKDSGMPRTARNEREGDEV